jgi:hypothetical protein
MLTLSPTLRYLYYFILDYINQEDFSSLANLSREENSANEQSTAKEYIVSSTSHPQVMVTRSHIVELLSQYWT